MGMTDQHDFRVELPIETPAAQQQRILDRLVVLENENVKLKQERAQLWAHTQHLERVLQRTTADGVALSQKLIDVRTGIRAVVDQVPEAWITAVEDQGKHDAIIGDVTLTYSALKLLKEALS